jgi:hypothetical protein
MSSDPRKSYRAIARKRWREAIWISGDGRFASVSHCREAPTVELHKTRADAECAKRIIDSSDCGGACRRDHEIVELPQTNRHPADELADVREEKRSHKAREDELRAQLIAANPADLLGEEWKAVIRRSRRTHIDAKAAIKHFGKAAMAPFITTIETQTVLLYPTGEETE